MESFQDYEIYFMINLDHVKDDILDSMSELGW